MEDPYLRGCCNQMGVTDLPCSQRQDERKWPQAVPGNIQVGCQVEFLHRKGDKTWEQTAQGSGGVTVHGGVQGKTT